MLSPERHDLHRRRPSVQHRERAYGDSFAIRCMPPGLLLSHRSNPSKSTGPRVYNGLVLTYGRMAYSNKAAQWRKAAAYVTYLTLGGSQPNHAGKNLSGFMRQLKISTRHCAAAY